MDHQLVDKDTLKRAARGFLSFDRMITPTIIKLIFYIMLGISLLTGLSMIVSGMNASFGGGAQVLGGLIFLVVSPLFVRLICESIIVLFKINESLVEIKDK